MDCRGFQEMVNAACDGELPAVERADLDGHLVRCSQCLLYQKAIRGIKDRIGAMAAAADPTTAEAALERAFAAAAIDRPARRFLPPAFLGAGFFPLAAAAVLVVAIISAVLLVPAKSMAASIISHHRMIASGKLPLEAQAAGYSDLKAWFAKHVGRAVEVPEIAYPSAQVRGGIHESYSRDSEVFFASYLVDGEPVTACTCCGPAAKACDGESFTCGGIMATIQKGDDYTLISWQKGAARYVLVTPFDAVKSKAIFATVK
jgi:anti-sigma factor RsiW